MSDNTGISAEALDHMVGVGCVVRKQYGNLVTTSALQPDTYESELWEHAAFTNGPPLRKITIEYAPV